MTDLPTPTVPLRLVRGIRALSQGKAHERVWIGTPALDGCPAVQAELSITVFAGDDILAERIVRVFPETARTLPIVELMVGEPLPG